MEVGVCVVVCLGFEVESDESDIGFEVESDESDLGFEP